MNRLRLIATIPVFVVVIALIAFRVKRHFDNRILEKARNITSTKSLSEFTTYEKNIFVKACKIRSYRDSKHLTSYSQAMSHRFMRVATAIENNSKLNKDELESAIYWL